MAWKLVGEYFENCSCHVLCQCLTSSTQAPGNSDNGRCQVPMVVHIREGYLDATRLDGLNFVFVIDAPALMSAGGWQVALYVDERGTQEQRAAIERIFSGAVGGPPEALAAVITQRLGTKAVPISYTASGRTRHVEVPGILDVTVEGITAPGSEEVMVIANVSHPFGSSLPIARASKGLYQDAEYGLSWNNTGKNGHYNDFVWQG